MALNGTNGPDEFRGTIFADEIFGLGGNDLIGGSPSGDTLDGGNDIDTVDYFEFEALFPQSSIHGSAVDVDLERSVQFGGLAEGDVLINIENVGGTREDDVIRGDGGANQIFAAGGDDLVEGRGGDDIIVGDTEASPQIESVGNDHLDGGAGDDILLGQGGNDLLIGGLNNDQLFGEEGNDTLLGDQGIDLLDGGAGVDTVNYGNSAAAVTIALASGGGLSFGFGGDAAGDALFNIENVTGSDFSDSLSGSSAANVLSGGFGNDTLNGRGGADTLNGGFGFDTATYALSSAGIFVDLATGDGSGGDAQNDSLISIENLIGSSHADILFGNGGGNRLEGGAGADVMAGRAGNDTYIVDNSGDGVLESGGEGIDTVRTSVSYTLTSGQDIETLSTTDDNGVTAINLAGNASGNAVRGNNGNNLINGAAGNDTLTGRGGADSFLFNNALNAATNVDEITDFNVADDTIQIDNGIFTGLAAGTLAANQFVIAAVAQDADDRIIYNSATGALLFDSDGTGATAAVQFAEVSAGLALTNLDFLVF